MDMVALSTVHNNQDVHEREQVEKVEEEYYVQALLRLLRKQHHHNHKHVPTTAALPSGGVWSSGTTAPNLGSSMSYLDPLSSLSSLPLSSWSSLWSSSPSTCPPSSSASTSSSKHLANLKALRACLDEILTQSASTSTTDNEYEDTSGEDGENKKKSQQDEQGELDMGHADSNLGFSENSMGHQPREIILDDGDFDAVATAGKGSSSSSSSSSTTTREGGGEGGREGGRWRKSHLRRSMSEGSLYVPGTEEEEGDRGKEERGEEAKEGKQEMWAEEEEGKEEGKEEAIGGGLVLMTASSRSISSMNVISVTGNRLSSLPSSFSTTSPFSSSSFPPSSSSACPLESVTTTPDLLGVIMHFLLVGDPPLSLPSSPPSSIPTIHPSSFQLPSFLSSSSSSYANVVVPPRSLPPSLPPSESITRHDRTVLSTLSLVCREWKDTARQGQFWRPILKAVYPVAFVQKEEEEEEEGEEEGAGGAAAARARRRGEEGGREGGRDCWRRGARGRLHQLSSSSSSSSPSASRPPSPPSYFALLRDQGRAILHRQLLIHGTLPPPHSLLLQFEVIDMMDGLRLLSCSGPFRVVPIEGTILLRLTGPTRKEIVGPPFSAASRDPPLHRYLTMGDYFKKANQAAYPTRIHVRATMVCTRTGRRSVIWESGKENAWKIQRRRGGVTAAGAAGNEDGGPAPCPPPPPPPPPPFSSSSSSFLPLPLFSMGGGAVGRGYGTNPWGSGGGGAGAVGAATAAAAAAGGGGGRGGGEGGGAVMMNVDDATNWTVLKHSASSASLTSLTTAPPLGARVGFYVQPAIPSSDLRHGRLPQAQKLWRLAGGDEDRYDDHGSFIRLGFNTEDIQAVGRFLQSLCA
ncbi:Hypothetical protein NocV09_06600060 [Nannochloropsis oceanica]